LISDGCEFSTGQISKDLNGILMGAGSQGESLSIYFLEAGRGKSVICKKKYAALNGESRQCNKLQQ